MYGMMDEGIRFERYWLHGALDEETKLKVTLKTWKIVFWERERRFRREGDEKDEAMFKCDTFGPMARDNWPSAFHPIGTMLCPLEDVW